MTRVLALDVGTSSVRAQVYDERGAPEDDGAKEKYEGEHEPDADEIVELARGAIDGALHGRRVDAVGGSSFGHSLLAVDPRGRPLTPVLTWRDTRSADAAEALAGRLDAGAVHARTGCHVHPSYWPAKLAWLAAEEPEVFRSAARFLSFPDYLYERLLGEPVPTSVSVASATGLLNLHTRAWDGELLAVLGVDAERLPRVGDEPVGGGEPWFPALLDGACSNLGAGCVGRTRAAAMIGTSAALRVLYESDEPQPRPGLFLYRVDERRVVEGGALSDGGNLHAWLEETLRLDADAPVADREPDGHGLTFLTLLGGERSPGWNPHARGAISGLSLDTTPLDLRQAALEGVAFRFAEVLDLLPEVEELVATGGGLLADADWMQILADVLERPLTASGVKEASARGAAVAALERLGATPEEAPLGPVFTPRSERAHTYRSARERQRALYREVT